MLRTSPRLTLRDYFDFARVDLAQMKLRTGLTALGVAVGVGALVAMVGFGKGMQKNVTESFAKLDLFNSVTVLPQGASLFRRGSDPDERPRVEEGRGMTKAVLDDSAVAEFEKWPGVLSAFPEIRFPAMVRFRGREEFRLVQVVPAKIAAKSVTLEAGRFFAGDDEEAVFLSAFLVRQWGIREAASVVGDKVEIRSLAFDFAAFNPMEIGAYLTGRKLPVKTSAYTLAVAGVTAAAGFGGVGPLQSDVFIPAGAASRMDKLPFTNIWDLFRLGEEGLGYAAVHIRVASAADVDKVKSRAHDRGFTTFALIDQFEEIKTGFLFMDMILAAVGMVAIFVAALGIINTMVMAVLERYGEIGIMKAVGASNRDVRRIFFFESGTIGLMGGAGGLVLGWAVSVVINKIVNYFAARQGIPHLEYFSFPLWLCAGGIVFAIAVSLAAGIYPAERAAKVDPAVALRHE
jgi:putative ABC transport system permease protein